MSAAEHYMYLVTDTLGRRWAECACGWESSTGRDTEDEAAAEWDGHRDEQAAMAGDDL